jgi:Zn-dependent protease with chaperone function
MFELITEHIPCLLAFLADPAKLGISLVSLSIAVAAFWLLKRKNTFSAKKRAALIYGHLAALMFPAFFFVFTMACYMGALACHADMVVLYGIAYALPLTLAIAFLASVLLFPLLYISSSKSRRLRDGPEYETLQKASERLGIRMPRLYAVDSGKPVAFSTRGLFPAVFVSVGMAEVLTKRELEAVLMHEAAHIREGSSLFKFSALLSRVSPFSALKSFDGELNEEEARIDAAVAKAQGTKRYLASSKRKLDLFFRKG